MAGIAIAARKPVASYIDLSAFLLDINSRLREYDDQLRNWPLTSTAKLLLMAAMAELVILFKYWKDSDLTCEVEMCEIPAARTLGIKA